MYDDANEFVFRRKRKRLLRIAAEDMDTVESRDGLDSYLIPEIATISEPATFPLALPDLIPPSPGPIPGPSPSPSLGVVTVERFLHSVRPVPPPDPRKKLRAYTRHRATDRQATRVRKTTKVPKRPREPPRAARALFRAAVLTGGDPVDTLVDSAGISHTRRPLNFVPFNKFANPFGHGRMRQVKRSDPERRENTVSHTRHPVDPSKPHHYHSSSPCTRVPLCLVPLREAEAAYSIMFPSRNALLKHL